MYDEYAVDFCYGFADAQEVFRIRRLVNNIFESGGSSLNLERSVAVVDEIGSRGPLGCHAVLGAIYERLFRRKGLYLALELLEFCVRNCGLDFAVFLRRPFLKAMTRLLKLKSLNEQTLVGQVNSTVKQLIKSSKGHVVGRSASEPRTVLQSSDVLLVRCQRKVLFLLQLWADAFMMHEDRVPDIMQIYRELRRKGYPFPPRDPQQRYLVKNAERSPAFAGGNISAVREGQLSSDYSSRSYFQQHTLRNSAPSTPPLKEKELRNWNETDPNHRLRGRDSVSRTDSDDSKCRSSARGTRNIDLLDSSGTRSPASARSGLGASPSQGGSGHPLQTAELQVPPPEWKETFSPVHTWTAAFPRSDDPENGLPGTSSSTLDPYRPVSEKSATAPWWEPVKAGGDATAAPQSSFRFPPPKSTEGPIPRLAPPPAPLHPAFGVGGGSRSSGAAASEELSVPTSSLVDTDEPQLVQGPSSDVVPAQTLWFEDPLPVPSSSNRVSSEVSGTGFKDEGDATKERHSESVLPAKKYGESAGLPSSSLLDDLLL